MKRWSLCFVIPSLVCVAGLLAQTSAQAAATGGLEPQAVANRLGSVQIPFIRNQGQIAHDDVRFYARTFAGTFFVTAKSQLVYALQRTTREGKPAKWVLRESFADSLPMLARGSEPSPVRVSQYKGNDPRAWRSRLETFEGVDLGELYPGIRVSLQASGNNVEKLFHVAPGGDVAVIDVVVEGVDDLQVANDGRLVLATSLGEIVFTAPVAYQTLDGRRQPVQVAYAPGELGHYGFRVGPYDRQRELVIDPLLESTYLGGHNPSPPGNYDDDIIHGLVVADAGVYVAGATQSPDFPVHLGYDETLDSAYPDGFVTLMSADLSTVIASTYIGTEYFDRVEDIVLDSEGLIAVGQAGYGFPVTDGAYNWNDTTPTGGGFVVRFSPDLSSLQASAVVTPSDYPRTVALGNGGIYFGGSTNDPSFPITPGAYQSTCCPPGPFGIREYEGFAGKLSADLTTLQAMTYLGGNIASSVDVAPDGTVFMTDGFDYAITGYLARFDADLTTRMAYLSYYPESQSGSSRTYFNDVVARDGYVVAVGQTYMNDLPATEGAFDTTCGTDGLCDGQGPLLVPRSDGFVAIYDPDLEITVALTYFGGSDHESIRSIDIGADGAIYVVGETTSIDFPTAGDGIDDTCGLDGDCDPALPLNSPTADGFVARLAADLSTLDFGTYLGGSGEDRPLVGGTDPGGTFYVAGYTRSPDFPTTAGAFDESYNGGTSDAFIGHVDPGVDTHDDLRRRIRVQRRLEVEVIAALVGLCHHSRRCSRDEFVQDGAAGSHPAGQLDPGNLRVGPVWRWKLDRLGHNLLSERTDGGARLRLWAPLGALVGCDFRPPKRSKNREGPDGRDSGYGPGHGSKWKPEGGLNHV